jgi:hypothetical protein
MTGNGVMVVKVTLVEIRRERVARTPAYLLRISPDGDDLRRRLGGGGFDFHSLAWVPPQMAT